MWWMLAWFSMCAAPSSPPRLVCHGLGCRLPTQSFRCCSASQIFMLLLAAMLVKQEQEIANLSTLLVFTTEGPLVVAVLYTAYELSVRPLYQQYEKLVASNPHFDVSFWAFWADPTVLLNKVGMARAAV